MAVTRFGARRANWRSAVRSAVQRGGWIIASLLVCAAVGSAEAQNDSKADIAALERRVADLEGQIVDLQVVIGTLESLVRNPTATTSTGNLTSGSDNARIAALETQIAALTAQMSQAGAGGGPAPTFAEPPNTFAPPSDGAGLNGFGATTVTRDPLTPAAPAGGKGTQMSALAPPSTDPEQSFEAAYGLLLQQKYDAAQAGFADLISAHPQNELAGQAQYWLGEIYFVKGDYRSAAKAFLAGYQNYDRGQKAPDSLLKLALSFERLGQNGAACDSLAELIARFPNAPNVLKDRARNERERMQCG